MGSKLGQHFLIRRKAVERAIGNLELRPGDTVIEIGPGRGALTRPLAQTCSRIGCGFTAVEKDEALAKYLRSEVKERWELVIGDALREIPPLLQKSRGVKLIGNLPYYLTGHLFRILGEQEVRPERMVFMLQKEVGERLIAKPPSMNRLGASVQIWSEPEILMRLHPEDFRPKPKVDSVLMLFKNKTEKVPENYYEAVRVLFQQPRKTILNNLAERFPKKKEGNERKLSELAIFPDARPQNLDLKQIKEIARRFFQ